MLIIIRIFIILEYLKSYKLILILNFMLYSLILYTFNAVDTFKFQCFKSPIILIEIENAIALTWLGHNIGMRACDARKSVEII